MGVSCLSWEQYDDLVRVAIKRISADHFKPDVIVGIARGGLPLLTTLSSFFSIREVGVIFVQKTVTDEIFADRFPSAILHGVGLPYPIASRNVLLVDSIIRSGQTMKTSLAVLKELGADSAKVVSLCKQRGMYDFDPFAPLEIEQDDWIVFPWDDLTKSV